MGKDPTSIGQRDPDLSVIFLVFNVREQNYCDQKDKVKYANNLFACYRIIMITLINSNHSIYL